MQQLFENLSVAVEDTTWVALGAAFVWGVLSIILSPCHLASIPLIVGFINGQGNVRTRRAFALSSLFAIGILVTIGAIGLITAMAGRMAGDLGAWAYYAVAVIFFVVGLHLLDVIPMPWSGPATVGVKRKGLLAALVLGLVFGVALGPCTFAYMAPVLGVTFKAGAERPLFASSLLVLYGAGHCSVIVAAGSAGNAVQRYLNWNERSNAVSWLRRGCGVLVILAGLYLLHIAG
jgi:cytochrome c-type biogenesis protein